MPKSNPRRAPWLAVLTTAALTAIIAAAIATASASASRSAAASAVSASGVDPAAAALVPKSVKAKGSVSVAADATYAPNEFIGPDGHTVVGMDADLAHAIFPLLGLKVTISNATFNTIIPGLQSGKFDVGMSSFTDTKAREKVVNFVDYFTAGESFFEKASGGPKVTGLSSICGTKVAVESGTTEQSDATAQAKKCSTAHKPADTVLAFPDQNSANLALSSGRAELGFADSPIAAYQVKQSKGRFKLVGPSLANAPYGIAVAKSEGTLDKAILVAVKALIANGKYTSILTKWGIQAGADKAPALNGATS